MGLHVLHLSGRTIDTRYFTTLVPALAAEGIEVDCGTLNESSEPTWLANTDGATHFALGARHGPGPWLVSAAVRLGSRLRKRRIDIVQTHLFEPGIVGVLAARMARHPVIVTRHHTDEMHLVGTWAHVLADRLTSRGATRVLGFSAAVRDYVVGQEGLDRSKVEVIPQGFLFDELDPDPRQVGRIRAQLGLEGRFVIGDVARFFATKGQTDLLRAARQLSERIDNLAVLLVGGGDLDQLRALVEVEGVSTRTVIAGHREDVANYLGVMDVLVHPSLTEAFCQVLIEAMAAGRPVVATDVGGAREVVEDGETGILIAPRDPAAIVASVANLHSSPSLRAQLGEAGRRSVRERFPVEKMVRAQIAMYDALAERRLT